MEQVTLIIMLKRKASNYSATHITKHLRRIPNARHFWFVSTSVVTAQCFKFSGLRCSPLNAALCVCVIIVPFSGKVMI